MDGTVLVADDDRTIRTVLTQALTRAGCKVHATASLVTLMRWIEEGRGDLVITDVVMPDGNGIEQVPEISRQRPGLPVIVISAQNTIMTAIQANEAEAFDYMPKPFDLPDLMKRSARALEQTRRAAKPAETVEANDADDLPLVGRSAAMQAIYKLIARVMNVDLPLLVTGESGTGKSLIAKTIHDLSDRRNSPFVVATANHLVDDDSAAQIIGRARDGTLLFDGVSDIDAEAQSRLVRMLDRLGDDAPRIMATSQGDLSEHAAAGRFRQDLYYRLNGVAILMPPLRERVEDIAPLVEHFLARAGREGLSNRGVDASALDRMRRYSWPGNVRQLDNLVRRLAATGGEGDVTVAEVEAALALQPAVSAPETEDREKLSASISRHLRRYFDLHGGQLPAPGLYARILREMELPLIEIALDATGGNQAKCADLLGINRNTLRKKITDLDIRVTRRRKLM